jgi:hypothetical protein
MFNEDQKIVYRSYLYNDDYTLVPYTHVHKRAREYTPVRRGSVVTGSSGALK